MTALLLGVSAAVAQEQEQFFEEEKVKPKVTFQWDFLGRFDDITKLQLHADIERGRFQLRPELGLDVGQRFRVAVRGIFDKGTDSNSDNLKYFDNYRSNGVTTDRWYLEARPGSFRILAGKFGMPLVATQMIWDTDIQTPGAAVSYETPAGASTLTFAAAGFYGPQLQADSTKIAAGQVVWRSGDLSGLQLQAAAAFWYFDPTGVNAGYRRQNLGVVSNNRVTFLSRYQIADLNVRLSFPVAAVPVAVTVDAANNFGVTTGDRFAVEAGVVAGGVGTPGHFRGFYTFQYISQDAILGMYNSDDWWFHSFAEGHRVGVSYTFLPQVFVQTTFVWQRRLDSYHWLNRLLIDLVKMF